MIPKNAATTTTIKISGKQATKAITKAAYSELVNFIFYRPLLATLPPVTQKNNATFF
jgi:hypothetical protein